MLTHRAEERSRHRGVVAGRIELHAYASQMMFLLIRPFSLNVRLRVAPGISHNHPGEAIEGLRILPNSSSTFWAVSDSLSPYFCPAMLRR